MSVPLSQLLLVANALNAVITRNKDIPDIGSVRDHLQDLTGLLLTYSTVGAQLGSPDHLWPERHDGCAHPLRRNTLPGRRVAAI